MAKNWLDKYAMGGALPGAVGFMYARTQDPAPSNGKYAKKTKASAQDGGLFSTNTQAVQDATRNVIPRKMTIQEKKEAEEASKKAMAAGKARDEKIIAERKKNTSKEGDINTPESWHTADKNRFFPSSVGGVGEMIDEYINPAMMVGSLTDALGESIAARSPKGVALSLAMAAGAGALGLDPIGSGIKLANSNALNSAMRKVGIDKDAIRLMLGKNGPVARTEGGISQAEIDRYMQNVDIPSAPPSQVVANQERRAAINQQNTPRTPYQAPTDAELARINEAEANRYAPRVNRTNGRPLGTPDSDEFVYFNEGREIGRSADPNARVEDFMDDAELARFRNRLRSPHPQPGDARRLSEDMFDPSQSRSMNAFEQLVSEDDLVERAISSAPPRPVEAGPKWGDKEFKLGEAKPGIGEYTDDKGNSFFQEVTELDDELFGEYTIKSPDGGYMKLETKGNKDQQGYLTVRDMTFRNEDEKIAAGHFKKIMTHLPPKVDMGYISTSMYSQPLMDAQVARWANNQPGRIELKDIHLGELNTWMKNNHDAIYDASTAETYGDYFKQLQRQFPRIQKTAKNVASSTGYEIPEPKLKLYDRSRTVPDYIEVPFEDLKTPEWKAYIEQNPQVKGEFKIFAPKYGIKKNWKNGGQIVDPMGQWAHPGEVTTIPSNDITMQGVDYPVLGVSDTGDTQMMYPDQDYKFDGEKVTEYPMAQNGKNIPTTADSTRLYNSQMALNKFYENEMKAGKIRKSGTDSMGSKITSNVLMESLNKKLRQDNLNFYRGLIGMRKDMKGGSTWDDIYKELFNMSPEQISQLENKGLGQTKSSSEYQEYYRDLVTPLQNLASPFALVDKRIAPQRLIHYEPGEKHLNYPGGSVSVYDYDPILIKPVNMLTPEEKALRIKKYGKASGIKETVSKPIQKPVSKPTPKPEPTPVVEQQPVTTPIQQPAPQPKQLYNYDDGEQLMAPIPNGWGFGTMGGGAMVGVKKKDGTIEYVKPEDYQRMGVPKYGQDYIKSKQKMQDGGWLNKYK